MQPSSRSVLSPSKLDPLKLDFSANISWAGGGVESDEGIEVHGSAEGVHPASWCCVLIAELLYQRRYSILRIGLVFLDED